MKSNHSTNVPTELAAREIHRLRSMPISCVPSYPPPPQPVYSSLSIRILALIHPPYLILS